MPGTLGPNTFTGGDLGAAQATVALTDASGSAPAGWPQIAANISGFDHSFQVRGDFSSTADVTNPAHQSIQTRIDLVAPVSNLVFALGDIDTGSASSPYSGWQDVVVVTAFFQGVEVPVAGVALGTAVAIDTNGNDYSTARNLTLYGRSGNVANTSTAGNARVTIAGPVDRVVLDYHPGNGSDGVPGRGPGNPNSQVYQIHDLVFDHQADVSMTKTVSDATPDLGDTITTTITVTAGGGAGLVLRKSVDKATALPGEIVGYTIRYANRGSGPLTSLVIHDATPAFTTYVAASARCTPPLPAGLTGCFATGPAGGGTGQVQWTFAGSLDPGASGTVVYSVAID